MRNGVILVMSCEQDRYLKEEQVIRETWGKRILNGEFDNLNIIFYRGGSEETYYDENEHILRIKCSDDLEGTYKKTVLAFEWLKDQNIEYDYVFRTNTSTYLNIDALVQFLWMLNIDDNVLYGTKILMNNNNKFVPFLSGYFLIISKYIIENVFLKCKLEVTGPDDLIMGVVMFIAYGNEYVEKHIKQIDSILSVDKIDYNKLSSSFCVRVKDEKNPENNIIIMRKLSHIYENIQTKIEPPHGFNIIETAYGVIKLENGVV